jgi:hypothetical protein
MRNLQLVQVYHIREKPEELSEGRRMNRSFTQAKSAASPIKTATVFSREIGCSLLG